MIENMRKYTGLMVVVFILLGAGFIFTMNDIGGGTPSVGGGNALITAYNQSIDEQAYYRMGERTMQLAMELRMIYYVNYLSTTGKPSDFIINRLTLQRAMDEMGLYASEEQITEELKAMPIFAPGGNYDAGIYATFVDKRLGRLGMTENDLREIVRENLCLTKLVDIIGGGLIAPRSAVQDNVEASQQTVTLVRAVLNRDDFVEKEKPTEEEIKSYWEANKDQFKTEEKRRISYLLLDVPDDIAKEKPTEEKTDAEKDKEAAEAKATGKETDKKKIAAREITREMATISDIIVQRYNDKQELELDELLDKRGKSLKPTELFSMTTAPKELKDLTLRGNTFKNRSFLAQVFDKKFEDNPYDQVSDPLPVGEHGWILYRLEEVIEPVLLGYSQARDKARAQLISENATKKVKEAADDLRKKIVEAVKAGKTFDAAVKEQGLSPVQVGPYSARGIPPKNEPSYRQLHQVASGLNTGDISDAIHENDRSLIIYVQKREIEDTEMLGKMAEFEASRTDNQLRIMAYYEWLNKQRESANVNVLVKED